MKICQCHDCSIVIKTVSDDYICDFNMIFYMKFSSYVLVDCVHFFERTSLKTQKYQMLSTSFQHQISFLPQNLHGTMTPPSVTV